MAANRSSSANSRARQALPPIRTLLGPELALSITSPPASRNSARPWDIRDDMVSRSPSSLGSQSAPSRPRAATISDHYLSPHVTPGSLYPTYTSARSLPPSPHHFEQRHHSSPPTILSIPRSPQPVAPLPHSAPASTYILRPSSSGILITATPPIRRPRGSSKSKDKERDKEGDDGLGVTSSARRHVCPVCGKRFPRPSSLKTHESVHTRSKPFACSYPGCTKSFSVSSNMRRHMRTHAAGVFSSAQPDPEPDHDPEQAQEDSEDELEDVSMSSGETAPSYFEWPAEGSSHP